MWAGPAAALTNYLAACHCTMADETDDKSPEDAYTRGLLKLLVSAYLGVLRPYASGMIFVISKRIACAAAGTTSCACGNYEVRIRVQTWTNSGNQEFHARVPSPYSALENTLLALAGGTPPGRQNTSWPAELAGLFACDQLISVYHGRPHRPEKRTRTGHLEGATCACKINAHCPRNGNCGCVQGKPAGWP